MVFLASFIRWGHLWLAVVLWISSPCCVITHTGVNLPHLLLHCFQGTALPASEKSCQMSLSLRAEGRVCWPNTSVPGLGVPMNTALSTLFIKNRQFQGANSFHPCLLMIRIRSILSDMVCVSYAHNVCFDFDTDAGFCTSSRLFWKWEERGQVSKLRFSCYMSLVLAQEQVDLDFWTGWDETGAVFLSHDSFGCPQDSGSSCAMQFA